MPHLIARAGHIVRRHQQHRHVTCAAKHLQYARLKEMGSRVINGPVPRAWLSRASHVSFRPAYRCQRVARLLALVKCAEVLEVVQVEEYAVEAEERVVGDP